MGIKELDKILIDTSIWIEFFRKKEPYYTIVTKHIDEERVCCIGIVLAELIQGAKSEKELAVLRDFIYVFDFLEESTELWEKAGSLSFNLTKKGYKAGLSDCYIAIIAYENNASILTNDDHFNFIKKILAVDLLVFR